MSLRVSSRRNETNRYQGAFDFHFIVLSLFVVVVKPVFVLPGIVFIGIE